VYDRDSRSLRCWECQVTVDRPPDPAEAPDDQIRTVAADVWTEPGQPGASARQEHERRRTKRQAEIQRAHPQLGGLLLRLSTEPQHISAWATGAEGEEVLGARLDAASGSRVRLLHDRRLPGSKANIDHLVICPTGVVVIDAEKYRGRPHLVVCRANRR
jgi:hypothetical protein